MAPSAVGAGFSKVLSRNRGFGLMQMAFTEEEQRQLRRLLDEDAIRVADAPLLTFSGSPLSGAPATGIHRGCRV